MDSESGENNKSKIKTNKDRALSDDGLEYFATQRNVQGDKRMFIFISNLCNQHHLPVPFIITSSTLYRNLELDLCDVCTRANIISDLMMLWCSSVQFSSEED